MSDDPVEMALSDGHDWLDWLRCREEALTHYRSILAERNRLLAKRHCACETAGEYDEEVVVWCKYHAAIRAERDRLRRKEGHLLAVLRSIWSTQTCKTCRRLTADDPNLRSCDNSKSIAYVAGALHFNRWYKFCCSKWEGKP